MTKTSSTVPARTGAAGTTSFLPAFLLLVLLPLLTPSCARKGTVLPPSSPPPPLSIGVLSSRIEANDSFVELRFRLSGEGRFDPDTSVIYLVDDASGERFYTMKLRRVGRLAEDGAEEEVHTVLFKNRQGLLRPGSRVTLVMGSLRTEVVLQ